MNRQRLSRQIETLKNKGLQSWYPWWEFNCVLSMLNPDVGNDYEREYSCL
jgi:hypothetical protein